MFLRLSVHRWDFYLARFTSVEPLVKGAPKYDRAAVKTSYSKYGAIPNAKCCHISATQRMCGGLPEAVTRREPSLGGRPCPVFGLQWWLHNRAHSSRAAFKIYVFCLYVKQENVECPETEWNGGYQQVARVWLGVVTGYRHRQEHWLVLVTTASNI